MTREIRFRAYSKATHKMLTWEDVKTVYNWNILDTSLNTNIMQFTGLKDKNGVEIYEGDIVRGRDGDIYSVVFENAAFRTNGIVPHPKYFSDDEVIGNVWENGELLK